MKYKNGIWALSLLLLFLVACDKENEEDKVQLEKPKPVSTDPSAGSDNVSIGEQTLVITFDQNVLLATPHGITLNGSMVEDAFTTLKDLKIKVVLEASTTYRLVVPAGKVKGPTGETADEISFAFSTASEKWRYEAEDAELENGAAIEQSLAGYSGAGYVNQKDGDITYHVTVPETGKYRVTFRYANDNQRKENELWVNDQKLASLVFAATSDWADSSVNVYLSKGNNILSIIKSWGWTYYDYIEVSPVAEEIPFMPPSDLVTSSASKEAKNLYEFLKDNFGQKVISGAMANYSVGIEEAQWMFDNTGKWPALAGFDLINYTTTWGLDSYAQMTANAQDWWENNGIVSVMWHWRDPLKQSDEFYTEKTSFDISKINDPNSDEYKAMLDDIDAIALYLKQFKDDNIPVLWRPLHEAAGGWFWWGAKGAEPCKTLWKLMFERMVNHHGLNNLIWVWTSDASDSALDWYPGDEYVDIIGMDIYPGERQHGSQYISFDKVNAIFGGKKLLTLSECGSIPSVDSMFTYGDTWAWVMPWNGTYTRDDKHNGDDFLSDFLESEKVITRDEMPSLK